MADACPPADPALDSVLRKLRELSGPDPVDLFGTAIRQSIDEVLDGPRTGRWAFDQLEKTEKTYVGTKLEIIVRHKLDLERGSKLDLELEGQPVDTKWAMNSGWQIPREAIGELCLCIGGLNRLTTFQVGLVRCNPEHLNAGKNRDLKGTLSAAGRAAMSHLVAPSPMPTNFVAEMDAEVRAEVIAQPSIQARIEALFRLLPYEPIPRSAVCTVARTTGDPMRRVRADATAGNPLGDLRILSARYGNGIVEALGRPRMEAEHFMSVRAGDIAAIPADARLGLTAAARKHFGLD